MNTWVKHWFGSGEGAAGRAGSSFPWVMLTDPDQLALFGPEGGEGLQVVFKHSTRCGLSTLMLRRFEQVWQQESPGTAFYLLDLIRHRALSQALAEQAQLPHQSPQVLLFKEGRLVGSASHGDIAGLHPADFQQ